MSLWLTVYAAFFALMFCMNIYYLLHLKCKIMIILYEFFGGIFLLGMILAYSEKLIQDKLNIIVVPVFILILIIDINASIFMNLDELGIKLPEDMDEEAVAQAGAVSLLFSAPAYIIAGVLCLKLLFA